MTTALILFLIILFCSLLLADFSWSNVLSNDRNEVVFAGRNHDYGAYRIRQEHHRVMVLAMVLGLGGVLAATVVPSLLSGTPIHIPIPKPPTEFVFETGTVEDDVEETKPETTVKPATAPPAGDRDVFVDAVDSATTIKPDTNSTASVITPDGPTGPTGPTGDTASRVVTATSGGSRGPKTLPEGRLPDTQPEYPGGDAGLYGDLEDQIIYPPPSIEIGEQGVVYVGFIVDRDGTISDVKVLRGVSSLLDKEAVRVVKRLKKWKPGTYEGEPVPVRFRLPIRFELGL